MNISSTIAIVLLTVTCLLLSVGVSAQRVGIGAQFGEPTGLSIRVNNTSNVNLDLLASWNFDDYFFLNIHGLWEKRVIQDLPQWHWFYGPGAFVVLRNYNNNFNDEVSVGISGSVGMNVYLGRLEFFGQITPRLTLVRSTDGDIGGGVGARFYLN